MELIRSKLIIRWVQGKNTHGEKSMIGSRRRGQRNRDDMSAKERQSFSDMARQGPWTCT